MVLAQTLKVNKHLQVTSNAHQKHMSTAQIKAFLEKKQMMHQPKFTLKQEARKPPAGATRADMRLALPTDVPAGAPTSAPLVSTRAKRKAARPT